MGMKALLLATLLAQSPAVPAAIPPGPVMRGDVHAVMGWQSLRDHEAVDRYNDWLNDIFYGAAGVGWYWNDHLKTQVDFGAGTRGETYRFEQLIANGVPTYESAQVHVQQTNFGIGQQYQFFRNRWFHPQVGGGVDVARRSARSEYLPVTVFDNVTRTVRIIVPGRTEENTEVIVRPFVETGFKAYMTRKTFFTSDARVLFKSGFDEVLFRFGFGVDF
jgi:hypothetical protein